MKSLLKFITCGSVDDGKSTLIGHILYDAKLLYADQEKALELDSKLGSREGTIDYSLLLDGLMAEREQGITIDVAYRYFTTDNRSFIVADTPGHEEYTRNMAVGASFADLAIILINAKQGVLTQTKRHSIICSLMGINNFVFAVNKIDLIDYNEEKFNKIKDQIFKLKEELNLKDIKVIPISATEGDNVTTKSLNTPWYNGPDILTYLENVDINNNDTDNKEFYLPIQRVCRPNHKFRGFQGEIEEGDISINDEIIVLPSNEKALIKAIYVTDKEVQKAVKGQPVTIQLNREVDVSRGCVLTKNNKIKTTKTLSAKLLWMDDINLKVGKEYLIKIGTKLTMAIITDVKYKIDVNTGKHLKANLLNKNEIALCNILLSEKIVADKFSLNKTLGELILIDRISNMTSACGVIEDIKFEENNDDYTFKYDNLNARGDIFEEYYYSSESMSIYKEKKDNNYTIGDEIIVKGKTYEYPNDFDILVLRDWISIEVRNKKIKNIKSIDNYVFDNVPIVNGRGFKINISSDSELTKFLNEYKNISEEVQDEFWNKWANINGYRKLSFHI